MKVDFSKPGMILFLVAWPILAFASFVAAYEESLVITTIVDFTNDANVYLSTMIELTACTTITNFNQYNLTLYYSGGAIRTYTGGNLANIAPGDRIYLTNNGQFNSYFGTQPLNLFSAGSAISAGGNGVYQLQRQGVAVDNYGVVGVDDTGGPADFKNGWVGRHSGTKPSPTFQLADWSVHQGAIGTSSTNDGANPKVQYGTYSCALLPSTPAPVVPPETPSPSRPPTLRPTLAKRIRVTPPPTKAPTGLSPEPPTTPPVLSTPSPTTSTPSSIPTEKPHNPHRHACPSGDNVHYTVKLSGRHHACQLPSCIDGNTSNGGTPSIIGTPFAIEGCGCGCIMSR